MASVLVLVQLVCRSHPLLLPCFSPPVEGVGRPADGDGGEGVLHGAGDPRGEEGLLVFRGVRGRDAPGHSRPAGLVAVARSALSNAPLWSGICWPFNEAQYRCRGNHANTSSFRTTFPAITMASVQKHVACPAVKPVLYQCPFHSFEPTSAFTFLA